MKKLVALIVLIIIIVSCYLLLKSEPISTKAESQIVLSDENITVDGKSISNESSDAVYSANDIVFYLEGQDFIYGEGKEKDEHTQSEADKHTVIHITKPGIYSISGKLSFGQIAVDLGKNAKNDPDAKVTLLLDGVDISCTVAPAVIFYNVYECGDKNADTATMNVDTTDAGANVIIADGTVNNINGSYVAKIYKSVKLDESGTKITDSKKLHKYDAAFYSIQSMNVSGQQKGDGILNITAENEGLDTELHLTLNGGTINITSGNDGINTNEDNVSVTTINGGNINILCDGKTGEGDGIDSNGWLVINGGTVFSQACSTSMDAGIDSDKGIFINGGNVIASGNMLDHIAGSNQNYAVFNFAERQSDENTYILKSSDGSIKGEFSSKNSFSYLIVSNKDLTVGDYTFWVGDKQLAATATNDKADDMSGERVPHFPDNMHNQQDKPPQKNQDFDNDPSKNSNRPQFTPDDIPQGERPHVTPPPLPNSANSTENLMPPHNTGSKPLNTAELTTLFQIKDGGNYFSKVSPIE